MVEKSRLSSESLCKGETAMAGPLTMTIEIEGNCVTVLRVRCAIQIQIDSFPKGDRM